MDHEQRIILSAQIAQSFTPGAPIDRAALFAGRLEQINDIINATTQPGRHVIMFGERGVGKTSLARVLSEILSNAGLHTLNSGTINCDGTDTFATIWKKVFRELNVVIKTKPLGFTDNTDSKTVSLEGFLPEKPSPDDVRHALRQLPGDLTIILDEFDRIKDKETTILLADTIKTLSDHAVNATLILVGVADAVDELILEHQSIARALVQVPMPRMSKNELLQIIDKGMIRVAMTIEDAARAKIANLSQGLPHFTHLLALHAAQTAALDGRRNITSDDVRTAIGNAVQKSHILLSAYHKATSSPQKQNLYDEVLMACSLAEKDELGFFSAASVAKPLSAILDKNYYVPSFVRHLTDFATDVRGPILQRRGVPRKHRFRFVDPLMQPFAILHGLSKGSLKEELITGNLNLQINRN